jgi:GNAT superfamily N-acetyltransferase
LRLSGSGGSYSKMSFSIRNAIAADLAAMQRVRNSVRENPLSDPLKISAADYLQYIGAGTAWVAEASGSVTGFAVIDAPRARIWALFVQPDAEGSGIGRALHDHMLDWAKQRGHKRLALTTGAGTRAERFYRRAGWRHCGAAPDGELLFEKDLLE